MNDDYESYTDSNAENINNEIYNDNNEISNEDDSGNYYDGEDTKPKLLIIFFGIILLIIIILLSIFACSKINKKSDNNYLNSIRITNGELSPEFEKDTLSYSVSTTSDMVTIACSAESSKATTSGCNKNVYLTDEDECVEHIISVIAQNKTEKKYTVEICKGNKNAPVIKSIDITPTGYTKDNVKVVITATSEKPLHKEAYSVDDGATWQESNTFTITENKTLKIKVRTKNKVSTATMIKEITTIDRTEPKVELKGSIDSGKETTSNVVLTALVTPTTTESGYKYEWYNENTKVSTTTTSTYTAKSSGTYKVKVITGAGNSAESNTHKVVIKSSGGTNLKITSVTGNATEWTNKNVKLVVNATSSNGLADKAYSFDGGKTYQSSKEKEFSTNQTVTIVVKDKKNNTTTSKVNITKIDKTTPKVSVPNSGYVGDTIKATVTPATTPSGYKYEWYNKNDTKKIISTSKTYTPNNPGSYYVVVKTGADKDVTSSTVLVSNRVNPTISIQGNYVGGSTIKTPPVVLTAVVSNGNNNNYSYEWYNGTSKYSACTTSTCTISSNGSYSINVKVKIGSNYISSNVYNFSIAKPLITISGTVGSNIQSYNPVTLTANIEYALVSSSGYKWYKNDYNYSPCNSNIKCTVSESGTYRVEVTTTSGDHLVSNNYIVKIK